MKNLNTLLMAAALTAVFGLANQARAGEDGIAASPKVRQSLNQKNAAVSTAILASSAATEDGVAASPKVRQALSERKMAEGTPSAAVASATASEDGIAASPKVRGQLNERSAEFTVAPLK